MISLQDFKDLGSWVLDHGVSGVLLLSNTVWFFMYLREKSAHAKAEDEVKKVLRERVGAEQANAAAMVRTHDEVGKTLATFSDLANTFMDSLDRKG